MEQTFKFELTGPEVNLVLSALTTFTAPLMNKIQQQGKDQIVNQSADTINADGAAGKHD